MKSGSTRHLVLAAIALLVFTGTFAQSVYDPLKAAKVKPNIVIVIDNSAEMSKDMYGNEVGVDEFGTGGSWGSPVACSTCGVCSKYTNYYRLLNGVQPSKMAILKNLLRGPVAAPDPCTLKTFTHTPLVLNGLYGEWTYVGLDSATGKPRFQTTACPNKVPTTVPTITLTNYTIAPQGIAVSDTANVSLVAFSGSSSAVVTVPLNSTGSTDVTAMMAKLDKFSNSGLGLVSLSVGRPINAGLYSAQQYLGGLTGTCIRPNAILLMTSGYNTGSSPSWPGSCTLASNSGGPPLYAESSWNATPRTRTFVYSMKDLPNADNEACENNQTAYYGRTGSTALNAGWSITTLTTYSQAISYAFFKKIIDTVSSAAVTAWLKTVMAGPPDPANGDFTSSSATTFIQQGTGKAVLLVPSTEFPGAKGHLYFYDLTTTPWTLLWDAATVLNSQSSRTIYTWTSLGALQRIDSVTDPALLQTINTSFGGTGTITTAVRDFIIGSGTGRWKLGPVVNSVATVTGPPDVYTQNFLDARIDNTYGIQTLQQSRHQLVWVGSSDGMLHAFDALDGAEILAILPPNLLGLQATLAAQYAANPSWSTGQSPSPLLHKYGVCSSPRWQDVAQYETNTNSPLLWKTLMFMTEGAGGNMIAALDVTHPYPGRTITVGTSTRTYPADASYSSTAPFGVQWFKTGGSVNNLPGLGNTWSVPAIMPVDSYPFWHCLFGSGDGVTTAIGWRLNAWDGTVARTISGSAPPGYGFPYGVLFMTNQTAPYPDNIANLGLLADLNGNIRYSLTGSELVALTLTTTQPLYYSPAVMTYLDETTNIAYDLYAFASGSYFATGPQAVPPKIYIGSKAQTTTAFAPSTEILPIPLTLIPRANEGVNFSSQAQVTTGAMMASSPPRAFFLVYDPAAGGGVACFTGQTYVVEVDINPASLASTSIPAANVFTAGAGVGTGMAVGGGVMIVTTSVVSGQMPFTAVAGVTNLGANNAAVAASPTPEWWFELK